MCNWRLTAGIMSRIALFRALCVKGGTHPCYQTVRELRWPDGVACPSCASPHLLKRRFDDTEPARQRYECHDCDTRFDDLTDTIFAGHHQPLKVWILCLYFMGLNISNEQIAHELALNGSDVQQMTA